ncbi:MAG: Ig-like domain-containing protein [Verrucomicrobiota bacterium]
MSTSRSLIRSFCALGLSATLAMGGATPRDVEFFGVIKAQRFDQDNPDVVRLQEGGIQMQVFVDLTFSNSVTSATLAAPNGTNVTLMLESDGFNRFFEREYDNLLGLNTDFADGTYVLTMQTVNDGTVVATFSGFAGDTYRAVPRLTAASYNAAQAHNANNALNLSWESLGGTLSDFVQLTIEDENGNSVYESPGPGDGGALNGTSTGTSIPGGTLDPGKRYEAILMVAAAPGGFNSDYPGVGGVAAYIKETHFHIFTTGGTDSEAPTLINSIPYYNQSFVPRHSSVSFEFSEPMNTSSHVGAIQWTGSGLSTFTYTWSPDGTVLYAKHNGDLPANTQIQWMFNTDVLRDVAGNFLSIDFGQFTTDSNTPDANDVEQIVIFKGQGLFQNSSTIVPTGDYVFEMTGDLTGLNTVTGGYLALPVGGVYPVNDYIGSTFDYSAEYASKTDLDRFFPSGNYSLGINAVRNGNKTINFTIPADDYPSDPTVSNLASLQALDHTGPITINWNATGLGAGDHIGLAIENEHGMEVYESDENGEILFNATSHTIPANTLSPGRKYFVRLLFGKIKVDDNTSYSGVSFIFAFGKETEFIIQTTGTAIKATLSPQQPNVLQQVEANGDKYWAYTLEASQDLSFWVPVQTLGTGSSGFLIFYDGDSQYASRRFYRIREPQPDEGYQQGFVALGGTVQALAGGAPIAGAVVSTSLDGVTTTTDSNGRFFLQTHTEANYSFTPYTVTVTKSGYATFSANQNWGDQPRGLLIQLSPP